MMCLRARLHEMAEGFPTIPPNQPLMLGDGRAAPAWTPDPQSGTNEGYSLDNQPEKHSVSLRSAIRSSMYCQGEVLGEWCLAGAFAFSCELPPSKNGALRRSRRCDRVILDGLRYLRVQLDWLLFPRNLQTVAKGNTKKNTQRSLVCRREDGPDPPGLSASKILTTTQEEQAYRGSTERPIQTLTCHSRDSDFRNDAQRRKDLQRREGSSGAQTLCCSGKHVFFLSQRV